MKWIKVRDGIHKFVSDSDPRPAVHLPKKKIGSVYIPFQPPWKKYERGMWNDDKVQSMSLTDKFIDEREHEMKTDPKAARWEKSRKARWEKDKPEWRKWAAKRGVFDQ